MTGVAQGAFNFGQTGGYQQGGHFFPGSGGMDATQQSKSEGKKQK